MENNLKSTNQKTIHQMALEMVHTGHLETALQLFKQAIELNKDPSIHVKLTSDRIVTEFLISTKEKYRRAQRIKRISQIFFIVSLIGAVVVAYRPLHYYAQRKIVRPIEHPATPQPSPSPQPLATPQPSPSPKYRLITTFQSPLAFPSQAIKPQKTSVKKKNLGRKKNHSAHRRKHHRRS